MSDPSEIKQENAVMRFYFWCKTISHALVPQNTLVPFGSGRGPAGKKARRQIYLNEFGRSSTSKDIDRRDTRKP